MIVTNRICVLTVTAIGLLVSGCTEKNKSIFRAGT